MVGATYTVDGTGHLIDRWVHLPAPPGVDLHQDDIVGPQATLIPGSQQFLLAWALLLGIVAVVTLVVALLIRWRRRRKQMVAKRPIVVSIAASTIVVCVAVGWWNRPPPFFVPEFPALPRLFPDDALFYRTVTDLPVAPDSERMIGAIGDSAIGAGVSSTVRNGMVGGLPFNLVDTSTARHRFSFTYAGASDDVPYPITEPAYIQTMPMTGIDDHYIGIDVGSQKMWELWAIRRWFGRWSAGSGAFWDLTSTKFPKSSTTAGGLPLMGITYTYADVASGSVDHVLGIAISNASSEFVWPARNSDGPSNNPDSPPMGTWMRLRADADLSDLGPQARVLAEAMQTYGMIINDTTGGVGLSGTPDARWDDEDLATLTKIHTSDLEVLDTSSVMISQDSMAVNPVGTDAS